MRASRTFGRPLLSETGLLPSNLCAYSKTDFPFIELKNASFDLFIAPIRAERVSFGASELLAVADADG